MENVKIGVLGVGHLGRWHVQQLKLIPKANLIGFFDTDQERCQEIASEFNVPAYQDSGKLIAEADAISIVTPTTTHFEFASKAIEQNKHVFIEKPITETVKQGEKLLELRKRKNVKLQVGHIERFNPAILALENIKMNPLFIESHRLSSFNPRGTDVPVVLDLMIHDIDLILSFVQSPVKNIDASGVPVISENEDIANCRIKFENGAVANVTASRISTRKMRKMRFFQPNYYISVDFLDGASEVYELKEMNTSQASDNFSISFGNIGEGKNAKEIRYTRFEKKDINPLNYELNLFIESILNDTDPIVDGLQGVRALKVADAILRNIELHAEKINRLWKLEK